MDQLSLTDGSPPHPSDVSFDDETNSEAFKLVHKSNTTFIYRSRDTGIKVILDPKSQQARFQQLANEQIISNFLPPSCHKRKVLDVAYSNGQPVLYFEWTNGITLQEWMQNVQLQPHVDLNVRLQAAMATAKTLSEFHDAGVIYNRLSPENIVLNTVEGGYVATFIDLSHAIVRRNGRHSIEEELNSLGHILNLLFQGDESSTHGEYPNAFDFGQGVCEVEESKEDQNKRKRGKQHLPGEGLPLYLGSLISTLLRSNVESGDSSAKYVCAKDVYLDLKYIDENLKTCLRRFDLDKSTITGRLQLRSDVFYGRQVEISMLHHLIQSASLMGQEPLMATISGYPGTGKSALVKQIIMPLKEKNGHFIEGKFGNDGTSDKVLASALNSFFGSIMEANTETFEEENMRLSMQWRINDIIGSGSSTLLEAIPNLQKLIADKKISKLDSRNIVGSIGLSRRLNIQICKLISCIASQSNPLVLFLDDLQWADDTTIDVIKMCMTDPNIKNLVFLGCYRGNEVTSSHHLMTKLNDMQATGINITKMKVGPIEKESVNALISDALFLPPSLCRPLSTIVHNKTGGIILFVLKFLQSLNKEGFLWFSMSSRRWEFNIDRITNKEISVDVVQHMAQQMRNLSIQMQLGLKLASCLSHEFDVEVLELANKDNFETDSFLEECIEGGFFQHAPPNRYKWSHDQIQQAAYELIPESRRESFHLLLGTRLFLNLTAPGLEKNIYLVVENMNKGSCLIKHTNQKLDVASLNLRAGEKSIASSAFHSAANYLKSGISLLESDSWDTNYSLTIQLYDAASEALFVTGDFISLSTLIENPLTHAQSFEDKLNINNNHVRSLIASGKLEEGFLKCVSVLSQLGVYIPTNVTAEIYKDEAMRARKILQGKSQEELLSLPVMTDTHKMAAMQFLNHVLSVSYIVRPHHNPIMVFRMINLTIEHGLCNISPFAFGCYGAWLVSPLNLDFEGGHRMGRIATAMMNQLGASEIKPRLYLIVYSFINIWKEPFQSSLSKLIEGCEVGTSIGDMEYGISCLLQHANSAFYGCGEKLEILSKKVQLYAKRAAQCNQEMVLKTLLILLQLASDLMEIKQDSFSLYFGGMTEESYFVHARQNKEVSLCRYLCLKRKYVAFWTGEMDFATKMYDLFQQFAADTSGRHCSHIASTFIDGLIALYCARKHNDDEEKWTHIGEQVLELTKQWVASSTWNFSNKLYLLEAEYFFLKGKDTMVMDRYNASIKAARDHKFVHEEGLAHEKAATYLLHKSRHSEALDHFRSAKQCYESWGAHALVTRVTKTIEIMISVC